MRWGALTVVLQPNAQQAVDAANKAHHRFEDAYHALEWLLARKPDVGYMRIDGNGTEWYVHVQDGDPIAGTPQIWALYQRDDHQVVIHAIKVIETEAI